MSISSQGGHSEYGGGRKARSSGRSQPPQDEGIVPPFLHQLDTKYREYEREGDIEFPFEDTNGAGDENRLRGNWGGKADALLATAGFVFGLGNLWRFPFLVHKHGGLIFFLPYIVCLYVAAVPIFFLEQTLGQFSSLGAISVWKAVPLFKGIGFAMVFLSVMLAIYLSVVSSWALFYLAQSFQLVALPWMNCENSWTGVGCSTMNQDRNNVTAEEFFLTTVLQRSSDVDIVDNLNWYLGIGLLVSWMFVFLCLFQSVKSSGKASYILVVLPYIILSVLVVRLLALPGALDGLLFYVFPNNTVHWERLADLELWGDAAVQSFYSLSCCTGGLMVLASYNRFHSNLMRNVWVISLLDILCSVGACALTFSAIGYRATFDAPLTTLQLKDGAYLLFVYMAEALGYLPAAPLFTGFFYLMLFFVILSTQLYVVETIVSSLCDYYAERLRKNRRHVLALVCVLLLLLSLPFCTTAGFYWMSLLDHFTLRWPLIILAFLEVMAISWVYGVDNLLDNIKWMTHKYPPVYLFWKLLWKYACPLIYLLIMCFLWARWEVLTYTDIRGNSHQFPQWTGVLGWVVSSIPVALVVIGGLDELVTCRGRMCERWRAVLNPEDSWGPALAIHRAEHFPLQIPEARRLLIACDDDFPPSECGIGSTGWKESRDDSLAPPKGGSNRISTDRVSHAATAASVPPFERETAI